MPLLSRSFVFGFAFLLTASTLNGQSYINYKDEPKSTLSMHQFHDPFAFNIVYTEAPHPSGKDAMRAYLRKQKLAAQLATPVKDGMVVQQRGAIPPPELLASFTGNNVITGTPLDNHLAVNEAEQIVSTINTHMLVVNNVGFWEGSYNLAEFYETVGTTNRFFDPRIIYDPQADRFIMVLINGFVCDDSQIVLAFSETNNPKGDWNLYALDGCLNDDNTFADYPMIAITDTELFLTYNAVHSDSSWQTGFYGTQIHQINKQNGYDGVSLNRRVWTDISFGGRLLRNIMPVRNADENLPTDLYFLSNRNFDLSNDTIFFLHLTGQQDDPNAELQIEYRVLDQPYGVPPFAVQTRDSLDTNDARVLDGFELNGQIQWVGNTMDFNTGRSGVFHGTLQTVDPSQTASGTIIGHPSDYLGYPGLAWTGSNPNEQDAIIVMSHASKTRNPGASAIYSNGLGEYSEFLTVKEGQRAIDMLTGKVERWGDYVGIQRLYHQPGSLWVSMSYGKTSYNNEAWIAKLARQEESTSITDVKDNVEINTYPNPTDDYVQIDIDNPDGGNYTVMLMDLSGKVIQTLYDGPANYPGKASINFSTHQLASGQYIIQVKIDGKDAVAKEIVKL
ncbi:MAG: T9SS type A sorting domain-containing protein [Saprospiraceae bacterium]